MGRRVLLLFILVLPHVTSFGQDETNSLKGVPFNERIVFGGGLGLGFSNVEDFVMVAPTIGYMVTKKFIAGTGVTYRYTNYKYFNPSVAVNSYGVSPYLRYFIYRNIFLHTEYEYLSYQFALQGEKIRDGFSSFMGGGGFIQPIGGKISFYLMALYNFSYQNPDPGEYSPYPSPLVIRAGINVGNFLNF